MRLWAQMTGILLGIEYDGTGWIVVVYPDRVYRVYSGNQKNESNEVVESTNPNIQVSLRTRKHLIASHIRSEVDSGGIQRNPCFISASSRYNGNNLPSIILCEYIMKQHQFNLTG